MEMNFDTIKEAVRNGSFKGGAGPPRPSYYKQRIFADVSPDDLKLYCDTYPRPLCQTYNVQGQQTTVCFVDRELATNDDEGTVAMYIAGAMYRVCANIVDVFSSRIFYCECEDVECTS